MMTETEYTSHSPEETALEESALEETALEETASEEAAAGKAERVQYYEGLLNEAEQVLSAYEAAMERLVGIQEKIAELNAYYGSRAWWADFDAWEAGELPPGLPCGVLSEDAVWNLLERNKEYIEED